MWTNCGWPWIHFVWRFGSVLNPIPQCEQTVNGLEFILPESLGWSTQTPSQSVDEVWMSLNAFCQNVWVCQPKSLPTIWTKWGWPWTNHITRFGSIDPNPSSTSLFALCWWCVDGQPNPYNPQWHSSYINSFGLSFPLVNMYLEKWVWGWPTWLQIYIVVVVNMCRDWVPQR